MRRTGSMPSQAAPGPGIERHECTGLDHPGHLALELLLPAALGEGALHQEGEADVVRLVLDRRGLALRGAAPRRGLVQVARRRLFAGAQGRQQPTMDDEVGIAPIGEVKWQ